MQKKIVNAVEVPLMILPKRNMRKVGKDENYRQYYTSSSRKIIEKIFEKDLKNFGYEYENE